MLTTEGLDVSGAMVTVADMLTAGIDTVNNFGIILIKTLMFRAAFVK